MEPGTHGGDLLQLETATGVVKLDLAVGNFAETALHDGPRTIHPLSTAHWVAEGAGDLPSDLPPVERRLSGDFLCAPFGGSDIADAPPHGWSANSAWRIEAASGDAVRLTLERTVMGAVIDKHVRLAPGAPLIFQEHVISGGEGGLTVAHHPMVRLQSGGRFCTSEKRAILGADTPLEPGRHRLAAGGRSDRLEAFPAADGGQVDLSRLPIGDRHEDFVTLVEAGQDAPGWTAILREAEDDIVFFLKDPRVLPVTMVWHSNGGRDYAPWDGAHRGVIGVEDGCAAGSAGHRAALGDNPVAATGVATALPLAPGTRHRIAHVIGAIARPQGWNRVVDIRLSGDQLVIEGDVGAPRHLPFPADFFDEVE